jgi:hypothetical protein
MTPPAIPAELAALDLEALVGTRVEEATRIIEAAGGKVRALAPEQPMHLDYRQDRVTLVIVDGVVRRVLGIG